MTDSSKPPRRFEVINGASRAEKIQELIGLCEDDYDPDRLFDHFMAELVEGEFVDNDYAFTSFDKDVTNAIGAMRREPVKALRIELLAELEKKYT